MEGEIGIVPCRGAGNCRLDRLTCAREDGDDAVPQQLAFDRIAARLTDDGAKGGVELPRLLPALTAPSSSVTSNSSDASDICTHIAADIDDCMVAAYSFAVSSLLNANSRFAWFSVTSSQFSSVTGSCALI